MERDTKRLVFVLVIAALICFSFYYIKLQQQTQERAEFAAYLQRSYYEHYWSTHNQTGGG